MTNNTLRPQMKIEAVISAEHSDLETVRLLDVSQSFVAKFSQSW